MKQKPVTRICLSLLLSSSILLLLFLFAGCGFLKKSDIGSGHSNISIRNNRLYTMGIRGRDCNVICLDSETGKEIWRYSYESGYDPLSTPTIEGEYIYALSSTGTLFCLKARNGKLRWKKDLVTESDVVKPYYNFAGSPIVEGDLIVLTANTSGLALDKRTGRKAWGSDKPPDPRKVRVKWAGFSNGTDYATPVIYENNGKRYAVLSSYKGIHSVEVATGNVRWLYEWQHYGVVHATDPLVFDNRVFITQYDKFGCFLLDIEGNKPNVLWNNKNMSSDSSSPVLIDGYIYGCEGGPGVGFCSLRCLDAEKGEVMWEKNFGGRSISLMAADGKLIMLTERGELLIAEASPTAYKEISSCIIPGHEIAYMNRFWTPPVLYKGGIYCRNYTGDLVCVDVKKEKNHEVENRNSGADSLSFDRFFHMLAQRPER